MRRYYVTDREALVIRLMTTVPWVIVLVVCIVLVALRDGWL